MEENEFISLSTNQILKIKLSDKTIEEFWISDQTEFKKMSGKSIKIIL